MHKQYHIVIEENNKVKESICQYGCRKYADEKMDAIKDFYAKKGIVLGLYEVVYYGNSFHHATKII